MIRIDHFRIPRPPRDALPRSAAVSARDLHPPSISIPTPLLFRSTAPWIIAFIIIRIVAAPRVEKTVIEPPT
ncbi:MAG TPA: hypothetical protein VFR81_23800 [Longimicrobium sp.]|nr:hypothetical protein [Longimicrobium sp.]